MKDWGNDRFDIRSWVLILCAMIGTIIVIYPESREIGILRLIYKGFWVADAMTHELGHTLFNWLFGQPAIPALFTVIGVEGAGGMSVPLISRTWITQLLSFGILAYACYWVKENMDWFLIPTIIFSLSIIGLAFTKYYEIVILYMGHGSSILVGAFLLFRAFLYLGPKRGYERFLSAFFGFFLVFNNMHFAYNLISDSTARDKYSNTTIAGASHHDLMEMTHVVYQWSVEGIAKFMIIYAVALLALSIFLAITMRDDFAYDDPTSDF